MPVGAMDSQIHPLSAPAGFGTKPGSTTGRISFPSAACGRSSDNPCHVEGVPPR